jgi:hypothetical protein
LDDNEIIRCGGRLALSTEMSYENKFPVILPKKGEMIKSLIRYYHKKEGHAG